MGWELFLFAWTLIPMLGYAIGRRRVPSHILARRAYNRWAAMWLAPYYGCLVATIGIIYAAWLTTGTETDLAFLLLGLVIAAPCFAAVLALHRFDERHPIRWRLRCRNCGYRLDPSKSSVCPECGDEQVERPKPPPDRARLGDGQADRLPPSGFEQWDETQDR